MVAVDAARMHALGARGLHEIHLRHFQHGRARHAHIHGHVEQRQRDRRHQQMQKDVPGQRHAAQISAHGEEAKARQPAQMHGEQQHRHHRQPIKRRGIEHQGQRGDGAVHPGARLAAGPRTQRHAQNQRQHERAARQQQRGGKALQNQIDHRLLLAIREAQVELNHLAQISHELHGQRLIEPELRAQLGDKLLVRSTGLARQHRHRITGRCADQQEVHRGDHQYGNQPLNHALEH
ncbi:hypothetical protein SDC9_107728 [bioreactor metagenome]|uniref:Uncharacterized protein n=1 Tax=bioreactor metagenome TaxID=1076179 RepID=A0A645BGK6_9ZZZZ